MSIATVIATVAIVVCKYLPVALVRVARAGDHRVVSSSMQSKYQPHAVLGARELSSASVHTCSVYRLDSTN